MQINSGYGSLMLEKNRQCIVHVRIPRTETALSQLNICTINRKCFIPVLHIDQYSLHVREDKLGPS